MTLATLVTTLVRASLEGAVFVLLVGAVTRLTPRMPAGARCALWWFASLRLLLGLLPGAGLRLALPSLGSLSAPMLRAGAGVVTLVSPVSDAVAPVLPATALSPAGLAAAAHPFGLMGGVDPARALAIALLATWLAGVVAVVIAHARDARRLARLWREAAPVASREVGEWFAAWVGPARAHRVELRASAGLGSPLILGGARTRILVPSTCLDHDAGRLRMALAHEMSHVRRGDLGWGLVPALAQCVFWFHPLAHWCVSEYAQTREEACDAEALRLSDAAPDHYGELLVGFGVDSTRSVHAAASCGSSHVRQLKRRLHMLAHATRSTRTQRTLAIASVLAIGLLSIVPVRLVAAGSPPRTGADDTAPATPASPETLEKQAREAATATTSRSTRTSSTVSYSYSTDDEHGRNGFSYGYSHGDGETMSGSFDTEDEGWLDHLKREGHGLYGWFRIDRQTYIVKGAEDVARIQELMRPETELGEQQGKLGGEQGRLGGEQSELGARQGALGGEQGKLGSELGEIATRLSDSSRSESERAELERRRDDIQARMEALSDQMTALGVQQTRLGAQQSALGEKQSELGRRQTALSREVREKMRVLAREMIQDGRAVRLEP